MGQVIDVGLHCRRVVEHALLEPPWGRDEGELGFEVDCQGGLDHPMVFFRAHSDVDVVANLGAGGVVGEAVGDENVVQPRPATSLT